MKKVPPTLELPPDHPAWEGRNPDELEQLIERGGIVRNGSTRATGQIQRTFVGFAPWPRWKLAEQREERQRRIRALLAVAGLGPDAVRPSRAVRRSYAPDPEALAACGERALCASTAAAEPWTVRIYYESAGGDRVCAEFRGLTEDNAIAIKSELACYDLLARKNGRRGESHDAECWRERRPRIECRDGTCRKPCGGLKSKKERAGCEKCGGSGKVPEPIPARQSRYRLVTFPSEIPIEAARVATQVDIEW